MFDIRASIYRTFMNNEAHRRLSGNDDVSIDAYQWFPPSKMVVSP